MKKIIPEDTAIIFPKELDSYSIVGWQFVRGNTTFKGTLAKMGSYWHKVCLTNAPIEISRNDPFDAYPTIQSLADDLIKEAELYVFNTRGELFEWLLM